MTPQELRDMAGFYVKRPAVSGRTPLTTEVSARECQEVAKALCAAADEIEKAQNIGRQWRNAVAAEIARP